MHTYNQNVQCTYIQTQSNIFLLILEYYTLDLEGELKITS